MPELAEDTATDADAFAREVVHHSSDCIKILDSAGRLLWMNDRGLQLMQVCDSGALIGAPWADFWEGPYRGHAVAALASAGRGEAGRFRGACPTCAGVMKWWDVMVTRVDAAGASGHFLVVSRDITDLMALSEEREQLLARERQSRTAAEAVARERARALLVVSHELRAPLNAVVGWSNLLGFGGPPDQLTEAAHAISHNAARLSQLVDQLVDAAQHLRGSAPVLVANPVEGLVSAAIQAIAPSARAKRLDVSVATSGSEWVMADSQAMHQAISNLLFNAVKFTDDGGRIDVSCHPIGPRIRIAVSDTGRGIARDFLPQLFEPFTQAPATGHRSGLGLGLSIARAIVTAHGGAVEATSPGPGLGSTFAITLPRAVPPLDV